MSMDELRDLASEMRTAICEQVSRSGGHLAPNLGVIELKLGRFKAAHKGQMELYLRWLAKHDQEQGDLPPLGIILCTGKKHEQIELLELDKSGIHVAEYLTVLPPREVFAQKIHQAMQQARLRMAHEEPNQD
jgi:hypothetical protein